MPLIEQRVEESSIQSGAWKDTGELILVILIATVVVS